MNNRGTGRTTRQIQNLKDGGIFVVHSRPHVRSTQEYAKKLGKNIYVISADRLTEFVIGRTFPDFAIDHYVLESSVLKPEAYEALLTRIVR